MLTVKIVILTMCAQWTVSFRASTPLDDPDVGLSTVQMIKYHGYPCQSHTITTEDGYILTYHRIPHGKNNRSTAKKSAALLMHGLAASSVDYINMGPSRSLGYILADDGYDVWLANARGNAWCRNHTTYDVKKDSEKFFDFSWHEIGYYDLPAAIDYILSVTGEENLFYIGHSQGATTFLVLASARPEYNDKIKLASLMAPPAFMENVSNRITLFLSENIYQIEAFTKFHKIYEIPYIEEIHQIGVEFCSQPRFYPICLGILFTVVGENEPQFDRNKIAVLLSDTPSNAALKQTYHYGQLTKNGKFSQYDYGREKNIKIYGTEKPSIYNLSKISAPVAIYYGKNDAVNNVKDVQKLVRSLQNVAKNYLVPDDLFNHFDFTYAIDVKELLYDELIKVMKNLLNVDAVNAE